MESKYEPRMDHRMYSCEFASIRGSNTSPPPRTSFVVEPILRAGLFLLTGVSPMILLLLLKRHQHLKQCQHLLSFE